MNDSEKRPSDKKRTNIRVMAQLAILTAIMLIMAYTPLGYIKIGAVEMTLMMIPVIVGAIVIGPMGGTVLGAVFGFTSFSQCFGVSYFGTTCLGINPFFTFIMCVVPRVLMGFISAIVYEALKKHNCPETVSVSAASLTAPILNTLLFVGSAFLFFYNSEYFVSMRGSLNIFMFFIAFVGINGLIELLASFVIGTALSRALIKYRVKPRYSYSRS